MGEYISELKLTNRLNVIILGISLQQQITNAYCMYARNGVTKECAGVCIAIDCRSCLFPCHVVPSCFYIAMMNALNLATASARGLCIIIRACRLNTNSPSSVKFVGSLDTQSHSKRKTHLELERKRDTKHKTTKENERVVSNLQVFAYVSNHMKAWLK
jgi:hypothetical protein